MTKNELREICDKVCTMVANASVPLSSEEMEAKISKYTAVGVDDNTAFALYCLEESRKFTVDCIYSVLLHVLDIKD